MSTLSLIRIVHLGMVNFWRNGLLSVASTLVIGITVFIVSVSAIQGIVILKTTDSIKDKIDLEVYFNDDVAEEVILANRTQLANRPDVKSVDYITKEKAYEIWQNRSGSEQVKGLVTPENNPLPRSLSIKAHRPENLKTIAALFENPEYEPQVRRVSYRDNQSVIEALLISANSTARNGAILTLIFVIISFILIYNTTKIVIASRKDEIEIMKLVGSTESFTRLPFLIEAGLFGFLGVLVAIPALYLFLRYDLASSTPILSITKFLAPDMLVFFTNHLLWIIPLMAVIGMTLSIAMSYVAVKRYVTI